MNRNSSDRNAAFRARHGTYQLAVAAGSIVAMACGCSQAPPARDGTAAPPFPITVSSSDLNLGTIWAPCDFSHTVHLKNTSFHEVTIETLKSSCGCIRIEPASLTIPPGATQEVTLRFHLSEIPDSPAKCDGPNFRTHLIPLIERYSAPPPRWELAGTIRNVLSLSTSFLNFENPLIQGRPFPSKTVHIDSAVPMASIRVDGGRSFLSLDLTKESNVSYSLEIQPRENIPPGRFRFEVSVSPQLMSGEHLAPRAITICGYMTRDIEPSPQTIRWGLVPVGRALEARVVVQSPVGKPFAVAAVTSDSESVDVRVDESNNRITLLIRAVAMTPGNHEYNVTAIVTNDRGEDHELKIPLTYSAFHVTDRN